ncbi:MAG: ATP-binding cassette domain-containing protein [Candidatus Heimdallarchaeota archaeon]|nr:ATP-binding cassette domain-containing protein [Candidatus Heimdallarchaeota archaeon]
MTGEVGSGKSTLLKAVIGLLPKQTGEIYYNDEPVDAPGDFFIPPISAYVSQVPKLFSDSIKNNLLLGLPKKQDQLLDAIDQAILNEDMQNFDNGLDTVIGPKGVKLSGGQKQRVAAARMFIRKPELYVIDDLSSALDVETEKQLWDKLFKKRKATYLIVSHRKSVLQQADQILLMKRGRLVTNGKLSDLLKQNEEMKEYWRLINQK